MLVTVGWAIYPLGYFIGYLAGGADAGTMNVLSITWPISGTRLASGLVIWAAAVADTDSKAS